MILISSLRLQCSQEQWFEDLMYIRVNHAWMVQIWNEEDCVGSLKAHTGVVSALAFDQSWLYSISWDGFIKVFLIPYLFLI